MTRAQLVIVDFRLINPRAGVRPALVIQNDRDNARMSNTIVAQVTTTIRRVGQDTQILIDANHPDWARSGLRLASAVNCSNVYTVEQADIAKIIGSLSTATMQQVDKCLKTAFGIA